MPSILKYFYFLLIGGLVFTPCPQCIAQPNEAVNGMLDLSKWDFEISGPVVLDGQWQFYWRQFVTATDDTTVWRQTGYIDLPGVWRKHILEEQELPGTGYASFRLKVLLRSPHSQLALKIPSISSAFRIYVNGEMVASAGNVASTAKLSSPEYNPQIVDVVPKHNALDIIVHVSNYHYREGGIWESIRLGNENDIYNVNKKKVIFDFLLFGSILIMGLYHLGLFSLRKNESSPLYFGVFCLLLAMRSLTTGEYHLMQIFPGLEWESVIKIELISIYLGLPAFALFLHSLFPMERHLRFFHGLLGVCVVITLTTIFTPARIHSNLVIPFEIIVLIFIVYGIYTSFKAILHHREGAGIFLTGFMILIATTINDILYANRMINTGHVAPFGLFTFIFFQAFLLSRRFSKAFQDVENLSHDLKKAEKKYRGIVENATEGIFQIALDGDILMANASFAHMLGYASVDEMLHVSPFLQHAVFADRSQRDDLLYALTHDGAVKNFEMKLQRKNGEIIYVFVNCHIVKDENRLPIYYEGILDDVTKEKQAQELRIARDAAEKSSRTKSEFLANMSHEIRTPLNGVIGMLEILAETPLTKEQLDFVKSAHISADSLLFLISDILDFSKIEAGKLEFESIDFDLRQLLENLSEIMAVKAYEKNVAFFCLIYENVPTLLRGDPGRLRQIISNLAANAIKFVAEGEITIRVSLKSENRTHARLFFEVKDTGIGIREDQMQHIFESFSQIDASTTRKYGGTGLGLTISRQLTELLDGHIGVESIEGVGSTFWFTVELEKQQTISAVQLPPPDPVNVLIVDENETSRLVFNEYLTEWNCPHTIVKNGTDALNLLCASCSSERFTDVLIDSQLTDMAPNELIDRVRQLNGESFPIVLIIPYSQKLSTELICSMKCTAIITKPVRKACLYDYIYLKEAAVVTNGANQNQIGTAKMGPEKVLTASPPAGVPLHLLLAEDNKMNQKVVLNMLKKMGHFVDVANNGKEACAAVRAKKYDMVLMDIQMPEMDGLEATAMIRNYESEYKKLKTPIIAVTANAIKGDRERFLAKGMDDYVAKPIKKKDILGVIEKCVVAKQDRGRQIAE